MINVMSQNTDKEKRSKLDSNVHKNAEVLLITQTSMLLNKEQLSHCGEHGIVMKFLSRTSNCLLINYLVVLLVKASRGEEVGFTIMAEVEISCF